MPIGTSNSTTLSFIKEATAGVTPASPAMQLMRFTGESLEASNSTTASEEIRDDRATSDLILTDQSVKGDIMGEFSANTYDQLLEAALFSNATWTTSAMTAVTTVAATASGFTDSANGFVAAGFQVGQHIKVAGFTASINVPKYRILTLAAGVITTFPAPPTTQASGTSRTLTGSTIKSGKTDSSFTIQKVHTGLSTVSFQNYRGCRISKLAMELKVGALAKCTFGITGMTADVNTTALGGLTGRTELARTTTAVMNCVGDVTQIYAQNASLTTAVKFTDLTFSYDNALRELKAIGQLGNVDVRAGTIVATATINPYFEDIQMLQAFLANQSFVLSFVLSDSVTGASYVFSFPNVKFTAQSLAAGAKDQDMIINGTVQAILDPLSLTTMRIDKLV